MKNGTRKNRGTIETSLALIEELGNRGSVGISALADELSLPKSTVHYHLDQLREHGFLVKERREYRLGLRFLELGEHVRDEIDLYHLAKSRVDHLAEQSQELTLLMVEEHGLGVYIYKAKGENAIDIDASIGRHAPLHNRAMGKAILAFMPENRVRTIIDQHGLPRTTEHTITDEEVLFEELDTIRERGVSFNNQESIDGLRGVAVPILYEGTVLGAMSIAGPTTRFVDERFRDELPKLLQTSRNVIELNLRKREDR